MLVARRGATAEDFGAPEVLAAPVNDLGAFDGEPFLADQGDFCELFFVSTRIGGGGGKDLYRAELVPLP